MSKLPAHTVPAHATSSISTFLTNLHLLDLDKCDDWPAISSKTFTAKNSLKNEKTRIRCTEWALYRLFELWDPEETKDKLRPFFPPLVPLQSLNLRAALFRCLNEVKKNGHIGKEVTIRKTMFDDCKGEKLQELLSSFSTITLRKVLATGQAGAASIAGRLALTKRVTTKEYESFIPLAIAHRASLTALLRRKRELNGCYRNFSQTLKSKEQELDLRFEAVISSQNLLDQNLIPDHTVSRVSALIEKNWQGSDELQNAIVRGEEHGFEDALLDKPFEVTWSDVSSGNHRNEVGTNPHGLLKDLERRVTEQQARLRQWKDFREAVKRDAKPKVVSNKQELALTRTTSSDQDIRKRKERDFVFSPRKSPRKSGWEIDQRAVEMSPIPQKPVASKARKLSASLLPQQIDLPDNSALVEKSESQARFPESATSAHDASVDYSDDSGFSEVSGGDLRHMELSKNATSISSLESSSPFIRPRKTNADDDSKDTYHLSRINCHGASVFPGKPSPASTEYQSSKPEDNRNFPLEMPSHGNSEFSPTSKLQDEDDLLAEHIVSMTLAAAPTPIKPKLSLAERTRQSMAFTASSGFEMLTTPEVSPPSTPLIAATNQMSFIVNAPTSTLLERTRQSISMLPPKPKASRKSFHSRRESKTFPTNQFETPKKHLAMVEEVTPPEVLFSPGAGYDSVFKSRPKVATSPTPSPVPGNTSSVYDREDGAGVHDTPDQAQWEESPLMRATAKV